MADLGIDRVEESLARWSDGDHLSNFLVCCFCFVIVGLSKASLPDKYKKEVVS